MGYKMADKRTERTLALIRSTFAELIIEQNEAKFTVQELTARAGINRKTFYLHFQSIEDLYYDLELRAEERLQKILTKNGFFNGKFSLKVFLNSLQELIDTIPALYEKLLTEDNYRFLFRNIKNRIKESVLSKVLKDGENPFKIEMVVEFVFSGLMKMFRVWHARKDEMPREEMIELAHKLIRDGIKEIQ